MTLSEALLLVIAVAAVAAAVAIAVLAGRIARAATEVEQVTSEARQMLPRVERGLARFEQVAERVERIAADVETVSSKAKKAVVPGLDLVSGLSRPVRYLNAAITGLGVGMAALRRLRSASEGDGPANNGDSEASGQEETVDERKEVKP